MSRRVVGMAAPLLLLALLLGTTAAHKATLGDAELEVNAFAEGTLRLRLRYRPDVYEVSDVVVGKEETSPVITSSCDADSCVFEHGKGRLQVSLVPAGDNAAETGLKPPPRFQASYSASGVEVTKALLYMDAEQPKADFTFSLATKLYGIPEHAVDLALKASTTYRLMNLDVFKYRLDDPGGIYGTIPFLMAHGSDVTAAVLFLNSADSSVGVNQNGAGGWDANWRCESGIHDVFFFAAGTPAEVHTLHAKVVGPTQMPPQFALGYHQCRWNYRSIADSLEVDDGFDTHNIPYDVLWLDIEHTDGKRYFTWDQHTFGEPEKLTSALDAKGRKLVTITDPHIKRDDNYHVHREARDQGFYVKTASGADFEGHCWPGQSSWVDFYNANARAWYATLFKYDRYPGSAPNVYTWIDMNEPSVFNAHEVTMDKTAVHHSADGKAVAHRDVHNMYGFYHTMAAHQGHILRSSGPPHDKLTRPFILTRSFFSGSQRYAAMWTGDNMADWGHLRKSIPMLLTLSLSNYIFVGADVGGFFDNPSSELLVRWYQTAIFTPFLRGHAHLETKRREPWLFGDEVTTRIRNSIAMRYALMPYLYTTFFQAHSDGFTVMRPMFYHWPREDRWLEEQNAFMFGPALLVRPIVDEGATSVTVPLPASENWFEFPSLRAVPASSSSDTVSAVTMDTIPLYLRGGSVLPVRERLRRSTAGMNADPITLYVAVNAHGKAAGTVYLDDTHSFDYQAGAYAYTAFSLNGDTFTATPTDAAVAKRNFDAFRSAVVIDKIVLVGLSRRPILATLLGEPAQSIDIVDGAEGVYILRRPPVAADGSWNIKLTF